MPTLLLLMPLLAAEPEFQITEVAGQRPTTLARLAARLAERDIAVLGEQHDNDHGHAFQLALIQALHKRRPGLAISLEMFERDVQGTLDAYLAGTIDEPTFLKHARPWSNYEPHYRPILEFARENRIPVIAGNVPRRVAGRVSRAERPAAADDGFVPRQTTAPEDAYWTRFQSAMASHAGAGSEKEVRRFYKAQCLKDDAMAEAILDFLDRRPHDRPLIVHLCGQFHSDYGLGTVHRLLRRRPLLSIGVVSMAAADEAPSEEPPPPGDRAHWMLQLPAAE